MAVAPETAYWVGTPKHFTPYDNPSLIALADTAIGELASGISSVDFRVKALLGQGASLIDATIKLHRIENRTYVDDIEIIGEIGVGIAVSAAIMTALTTIVPSAPVFALTVATSVGGALLWNEFKEWTGGDLSSWIFDRNDLEVTILRDGSALAGVFHPNIATGSDRTDIIHNLVSYLNREGFVFQPDDVIKYGNDVQFQIHDVNVAERIADALGVWEEDFLEYDWAYTSNGENSSNKDVILVEQASQYSANEINGSIAIKYNLYDRDTLQKDLQKTDIDSGNVRVFGISHLPGEISNDDILYLGSEGGDTMDLSMYQKSIVVGAGGSDNIIGTSKNDTIYGDYATEFPTKDRSGDDTIYGGAGDDQAFGGYGQDSIDGGAGDDILDGEVGSDTLIGGLGRDVLFGGDGDDQLAGDEIYASEVTAGFMMRNDKVSDTLNGGEGFDIYGVAGYADWEVAYPEVDNLLASGSFDRDFIKKYDRIVDEDGAGQVWTNHSRILESGNGDYFAIGSRDIHFSFETTHKDGTREYKEITPDGPINDALMKYSVFLFSENGVSNLFVAVGTWFEARPEFIIEDFKSGDFGLWL